MGVFENSVRSIASSNGWTRLLDPSDQVHAWAAFVEECESGYGWSLYEYRNELGVRDVIELEIQEEALGSLPQFRAFRAAVEEWDARFSALLRDGAVVAEEEPRWWRAKIPSFGGSEFCADVLSAHGVTIESR